MAMLNNQRVFLMAICMKFSQDSMAIFMTIITGFRYFEWDFMGDLALKIQGWFYHPRYVWGNMSKEINLASGYLT